MKKQMLLAAIFAAAAVPLAAQQQPLTHVAVYRVKPAMESTWQALAQKHMVPVLERLLKDGVVLAYGIELDILHQPAEPNADAWFTVPNWAAYQKVQEAIAQMNASLGDAAQKQLRDCTDADKHFDILLRPVLGKQGPAPAGVKPIAQISYYRVKPAFLAEHKKGVETMMKPVLDKMVDDGTLLSWWLFEEDMHSKGIGARWLVLNAPNMAALDKLDAAFDADQEKRGEEWKAATARSREITETGEHRDFLSRSIAFGSK